MQITPSPALAAYIKNFTVITVDRDIAEEVFYPSGYVDLVINISGAAKTIINGKAKNTPHIELLGQLTLPTRLTASCGTCIIIARFYPYAASLFFSIPVSEFSNYATDMYDLAMNEHKELYDRVMCAGSILNQIRVLEIFLYLQLQKNESNLKKAMLVQQLTAHLQYGGEVIGLSATALQSGLSERYIQKLYHTCIGISPSTYAALVRFNKSLQLVLNSPRSLTSIAYDCGYYDQAHFIKEFKKFTAITPLTCRHSKLKNDTDYQQAVNIGF